MNDSLKQRARRIFMELMDRPDAERTSSLVVACEGDSALCAEVEALLQAHADAGAFMGTPTVRLASDESPTLDSPSRGALATVESPHERPGSRIGAYRLIQLIGEGGFGSVFMAEQEKPVRRRVALKIIKLGMDTRQVVARFEQERQALAILDHPNIAKVFDAGATDAGRPYFVMELCTGEPIDAYCDKHKLSIAERLDLFAQVCQAVQHAHTKGIIHRDIKPSNVLVHTQDGRPQAKVIDFGIAKATNARLTERTLFTEHRQIIGTPEYMSPEQAEGSLDIDTRTDVYALGVMMYELLTGSTPFSSAELRSAAYAEIQRIICQVDPPRPSTRLGQSGETLAGVAARRRTEPRRLGLIVRGELDWIVMKALEKDRQRRYESANGLLTDIRRYLAGEAVLAAPPSGTYRLRKFVRRNRARVVVAAMITAVLVLGVIGTSVGMVKANRSAAAERLATQEAERKRGEAETNLAFAKKANEILGSVFTNLDPSQNFKTIADLRGALRDNLDTAVKQIDGATIGDPVDVARMQNTLGRSLQRLGDPLRAIPLFEKSLNTLRLSLGADHSDTLDAANNLAVAYLDTGKPDLALPLLEAAQARREATLGLHDSGTIAGMRNLAGTYFSLGRHDQAEELVNLALQLGTANLGPDRPETLLCAASLAMLYVNTDRSRLAIPLLEQTLERQTATLGRDHPDTLNTLHNLANAYGESGQGDRALPTLEDAFRRSRTALGDDHLLTLNITCQLAAIYWGMGRIDEAIPLFERALTHQERLLGRDNPATLGTIANLGINYKDAGRLTEALPLLEEAFAASARNPDLEYVAEQLLDAYTQTGDDAKAAALLDSILAEARRDLPADNPELASLLARTGLARLTLKQWKQAEPLLRESLSIRQKLAPEAWTTFNTRSLLGGALTGQAMYAEAEPLLLEGYRGMKDREADMPPQAGTRIPEALDRLIEFYTATNRPEDAKAWQARRAKYPAASKAAAPK